MKKDNDALDVTSPAPTLESGTAQTAAADSAAAALAAQLEAERARHAEEIAQLRAEGALREALIRGGAYNPALALGAIDLTDMEGDERTLRLLAEQKTAALRGSDPYLFRAQSSTGSTGARHGASGDDTDDLTDSEYYSRLRM